MKNFIIIAIISLLLALSSSWAAESPTDESSLSKDILGLLEKNQIKEALELYKEGLQKYEAKSASYKKESADYRIKVERHNANRPGGTEETKKAYNEEIDRLMEQKKQLDAMRSSLASMGEELKLANQQFKGKTNSQKTD